MSGLRLATNYDIVSMMSNGKTQKKKYDYSWRAIMSNAGTLDLDVSFLNKKLSAENKKKALAGALAQSYDAMLKQGYTSDTEFLSPRDIAKQYGNTRQYWQKLLNEGKIRYKETSAGRITTNLWVEGYLNNKEIVNEYLRNERRVLQLVKKDGHKMGVVKCPACGEPRFNYHMNANSNINGLCRNTGCGFRIHTVDELQ